MNPTVKFDISGEDIEEATITCPFCHKSSSAETSIQYDDDYVDCPMLWCDTCDARSVFDRASFTKVYDLINANKEDKHMVLEIPLLFIERMADCHMSDFKSTRELNCDEIKLLVDSQDYKYKNNYNPEIVKQLGLTYRFDNRYNDEYLGDSIDYKTVMNISVPINSYNAFKPEKEFDCNVSLAHDGVYITLLVVGLDDTKELLRFGGRLA